MRKLLFIAALLSAFTLTQTARSQGLLVGLYNSVSNQLSIVSNTVPVDTKLAKSLNGVLSTIQKSGGGATLPTAIKSLSAVITTVNRTSVSNALQGSMHSSLLLCVTQYVGNANVVSNQLAGLFPSTSKTLALNALSNLVTSIAILSTNANLSVAVKSLSGLSKQVTTVQKAVVKAQSVPAPAASVTASIVISGTPTFNFKSTTAVAQHTGGGNFLVNSAQTVIAGTASTLHSLAFGLYGLVQGPNTTTNSDGEYSRVSFGGAAGAYEIKSGTVQTTYDPTHKLISGSFVFNIQEQTTLKTGTVTGNFTCYYP